MRVPLNWLRDYVSIDIEPAELADRLTMAGLEVDDIEYPARELEGVVIGEIKEVVPHPEDSSHLLICQVDIGREEMVQVVTAAPNVHRGQKVALALPGTRLPDGREIRHARFRGVDSMGMLCSAPELGLGGQQEDGILELPADGQPGLPATQALGVEAAVLVLEVTPNRADCLGLINLAREVATLTGSRASLPEVHLIPGREKASDYVQVQIADPGLCRRYVAKVVRGIKIGSAPAWMQRRLEAAGIRSVNNIVDVTNYVMLETGQPLHAFDYHKISGGRIVVRRAIPGEKIRTLDGFDRALAPSMLVIADADRPVAVAGVMGGEATAITPDTTTVLLESACFAPDSVRQTSRQMGLVSEASLRFARGVDPQAAAWAAERACQFMADLAGGEVLEGSVDVYPRPWSPVTIGLHPQRVAELLGLAVDAATIEGILQRLGVEWYRGPDGVYRITPPSYRPDLALEADLIEEIARLYGYHRIPVRFPPGVTGESKTTVAQELEEAVREILVACGLNEVVTFSFMGKTMLDQLGLPAEHPWRQAVELQNPLREEHKFMRTNLLGGMLEVAKYNAARRQRQLRLFEVARVFRPRPGQELPEEILTAAALVSGQTQAGWDWPAQPVDFFYLKGVLEEWLARWHIEAVWERTRQWPFLHPGRAAAVLAGRRELGFLGEIHPEVREALELTERVTVFHIDLEALFRLVLPVRYRPWGRFPAVERDLAVVLPEEVPAAQVEKAMREAGYPDLESCYLFDLYRGNQVPEGYRSLAFHLVYRSPEHTLVEEEVNEREAGIVNALQRLGGMVRRA